MKKLRIEILAGLLSYMAIVSSLNAEEATNEKDLSLDCRIKAIAENGEVKEVSERQAKSNPGFIQQIQPRETELVVSSELGKFSARFSKQVLRKPDGSFDDEIQGPGVVHDVYISSGDELTFEYFISWDDSTLYTEMMTWMYETDYKEDQDDSGKFVFSSCVRS